jgi:dTDP-4-amino-4,6-dideoxygalactose transaminase
MEELALFGGKPVRNLPLPPWPKFDEITINAATAVLRSGKINYWTGDEGSAFESEFAQQCNCSHAVAVANGTVALELALHALDIGPGDEVIVPSRTFVASASCCLMRGAKPMFADVDAQSQTITASTIRPLISTRTRAVIVVHLAGWPCEVDPILSLAAEFGFKVIEDCAQAHGATYKGRPVGGLGAVAAFSFCQDKIISTGGEGGMLTTSDACLWQRAWSFKDHGKDYSAVFKQQHAPGFRWLHQSPGTNWRLTEFQSAIGRAELRRLQTYVSERRHNALCLARRLTALPGIRVPLPPQSVFHSFYRLYAFVEPSLLAPGWSRDRVLEAIQAEGVPCFTGSCSEVYLEQAFASIAPPYRRPVARYLGESSLAFLVHPGLTNTDIDSVADAVEKVLSAATVSRLAASA